MLYDLDLVFLIRIKSKQTDINIIMMTRERATHTQKVGLVLFVFFLLFFSPTSLESNNS